MSLFLATLLTGLALLALGGLLLWNGKPVGAVARDFPRSQRAAVVFMGISSVWFLYHITQLGDADFGDFRRPLFIGFAAVAILSFRYARDFLAVRGVCIFFLLVAAVLLNAAFMQEPASRLFLVTFAYAGIFLSLYLAASPFRLRDFIYWLFRNEKRPKVLGGIFFGYGLILNLAAFTY
ncbi:MAG: hypothetical protein WD490_05515 [Opitutales bacterium]